MNQVSLVGRITRDLTLRKTNDGNNFAGFTLAVSEYRGGKDYTNFIDCIVFGNQAENVVRYVGKGSLVSVTGRLSVRNQQENGNYSRIVNVNVDRIEFLESKSARQQYQENERQNEATDLETINSFAQDKDDHQKESSLVDEDEIL
jgi:single-strand DNA-binding protein